MLPHVVEIVLTVTDMPTAGMAQRRYHDGISMHVCIHDRRATAATVWQLTCVPTGGEVIVCNQ